MVASGAFIGQNSVLPSIASGRPDNRDKDIQLKFGKNIYDKVFINKNYSFNSKLKLDWPKIGKVGTLKCALLSAIPGLGFKMPFPFNELSISESCIKCGKCVGHCPMEAISLRNRIVIDAGMCIGCAGCSSVCPKKAIEFTNPLIVKMIENTESMSKARREPDVFF